jgi:hypothetical protein
MVSRGARGEQGTQGIQGIQGDSGFTPTFEVLENDTNNYILRIRYGAEPDDYFDTPNLKGSGRTGTNATLFEDFKTFNYYENNQVIYHNNMLYKAKTQFVSTSSFDVGFWDVIILPASSIEYDNTTSKLVSTNVQDSLDELQDSIETVQSDLETVQSNIEAETEAREEGDATVLASAKEYTDVQIAQAELSKQIWLEAVQTKVDLPDPSTLPAGTNYLCRVINDSTTSNNGVWQRIANTTVWSYFSDNLDFVDEDELDTALALKQNSLNRTIQTNLASTAAATDTGNNITPGITGILPIANGGTGNNAGNAASATKLQTARTINGVSFDGTANIIIASLPNNLVTVSGEILKISGLASGYSPGIRWIRITKMFSGEYSRNPVITFDFMHTGRSTRSYFNITGDYSIFTISDVEDGSFTIKDTRTIDYKNTSYWMIDVLKANGLSVSAG